MQYIEKIIEDDHTGAEVKYHEIIGYSVDLTNRRSTATVASYISRKTREQGKEPVGSPIVITLDAIPDAETHPLTWLYAWLIQPKPDNANEPDQPYYGYVSPYKFSGGKLKTNETA